MEIHHPQDALILQNKEESKVILHSQCPAYYSPCGLVIHTLQA